MRSYAGLLVPMMTRVGGALLALVSVFRSCPLRRAISATWRRVLLVTVLAVLVAWSAWLLRAVGLLGWLAATVMDLPWYGWVVLAVLAVWLVGTIDNHWLRYRATKPVLEPEHTLPSRS